MTAIPARRRLLLPMLPFAFQQRRPPNILMIAVDDLNTDLGCYGHPLAQTPNIDALARRGVRFHRAFCQYPVCNPSRTSFLSGRYPETTGILDNRVNPRANLPAGTQFLPEFLRAHGYFTARVGKIFHDGMDGERDWDASLDPRPPRGVGNTGEGRNLTGGKFAFFQWRAAEGDDTDQPDGLIAADAVRILRERRDKPLFLAVGFRKPHDPYIAPKRYFEPYPLARIAETPGPADDESDIPAAAYPPVRHNLGPLEGREYRRAYLACTSFMDAQVGKVLAEVDTANTLVVFFGDHGLHMGEHGWWNKVTLFERSARVPLIIAAPGARAPGDVCHRPVELLGLYPTLASYAGLAPPPGLQGVSLRPLVEDPRAAWSRPAYTVVVRGDKLGRSVQTERYRYTEWDRGKLGVELYDHDTDPREYRNLAGDAAYGRVVEQLRSKIPALTK
jgi:uncharacterized sulfatase